MSKDRLEKSEQEQARGQVSEGTHQKKLATAGKSKMEHGQVIDN